jgi:hypothetical protein
MINEEEGRCLVAVVRLGSLIVAGVALLASGCASLAAAPASNNQASIAAQVEATVAARSVAPAPPPIRMPPTVVPPEPRPQWNTTDMDVATNGNLAVATSLIRSNGVARAGAKTVDIGTAAKAPFRYFGDVYQFSGTIGLIQEYAPGSAASQAFGGGVVSEVVLVDSTGRSSVPIDYVMLASTGNVKEGDQVIIWGHIVGMIDATNRLGGKTTELAVIGKEIQKRASS